MKSDIHCINLETWNTLARWYTDTFWEDVRYREYLQKFLASCKAAKPHVLDLGCGPGNTLFQLYNLNPNITALGIDGAQEMIKTAKERLPQFDFLIADCTSIPNGALNFDAAILSFILPYIAPKHVVGLFESLKTHLKMKSPVYISFITGSTLNDGLSINSQNQSMYQFLYEPSELELLLKPYIKEFVLQETYLYNRGDGRVENQAIWIGVWEPG